MLRNSWIIHFDEKLDQISVQGSLEINVIETNRGGQWDSDEV